MSLPCIATVFCALELQIIYYDDGSTDLATKDYDRKQRCLRTNEIESLQTLLAAWDTLEEM